MWCRGQGGGDDCKQRGVLHHPQRHPTLIRVKKAFSGRPYVVSNLLQGGRSRATCTRFADDDTSSWVQEEVRDITDGFGKDRQRREHGLRNSIRRLRAQRHQHLQKTCCRPITALANVNTPWRGGREAVTWPCKNDKVVPAHNIYRKQSREHHVPT
ncbi:hypothetical protein K443DRAFT_15621 [Laccaria amethystina LaAM-08-1]|uniref:Uncharacterized protein n=1 Tax=Laccaria amethystina LaAM-08-1 TaxID=1095629 RepID=A0A0C9X070_9AGAR|nr:hypothetical protein K443DRAFT_15621 [Laccaria amethystina LaAM-08-1]